jgi:hypothetical protein
VVIAVAVLAIIASAGVVKARRDGAAVRGGEQRRWRNGALPVVTKILSRSSTCANRAPGRRPE